jgi:gamma-glutamylputrescine oxidase
MRSDSPMTESSNHTFYAAESASAPARPQLTHDIETEVCVVGGGFAGLWAARALAARGQEVVLLEAGEIADGASGQNGGFVTAGYAARLENIVARVGLDHARALYGLSREGVEIVRRMASADAGAMQVKSGRLHVLRHNDEVGLSDYGEMLARDFGHELDLWPMARVREVLASGQYYQALHEADAFHLNPLNLSRSIAAEIEDRGGRIFEHSRVLEADILGLRKSFLTERGRVRAFNVVIAGSAAVGAAFPWLEETILPVRTHIAVTAPLGDSIRHIIGYEGAIADTRRAGDYYHLAGDRLLWGGRISARRDPPRKLEQLMGRDIARVYPQLKDVPIEYAWSGVMGYAVHMMPQIGMAQPGVWVSTAFGGHGLNTSAMAGELVASAIVEQDDRWRQFLPFGLVWNGGGVGRALAQATYWGMQAKDWLDEAQTRAIERDDAAVGAGLVPGIAAHAARRAKQGFIESSVGHASFLTIRVLKQGAILSLLPFLWMGRQIDAAARAVGRALIPVIWFIAGIIGFIARAVGRGMDATAAAIVIAALATARYSVRTWNDVIVPGAIRIWAAIKLGSERTALAAKEFAQWAWAKSKLGSTRVAIATQKGAIWAGQRARDGGIWAGQRIREHSIRGANMSAAFAKRTWENAIVPASKRFSGSAKAGGLRAKAEGRRALEQGRKSWVAFGQWSAKQPGIVWKNVLVPAAQRAAQKSQEIKSRLIEAQKQRAEQERITAAEDARKEAEEKAVREREAALQEEAKIEAAKADGVQQNQTGQKLDTFEPLAVVETAALESQLATAALEPQPEMAANTEDQSSKPASGKKKKKKKSKDKNHQVEA